METQWVPTYHFITRKRIWSETYIYLRQFLSFSTLLQNSPFSLNLLGNTSHKKNRFLSGIARKGGGEGLARIFWPFFPPCCPLYFDINIMLFDTFWSFLTPKSSKVPKLLSQLSFTSLLLGNGFFLCEVFPKFQNFTEGVKKRAGAGLGSKRFLCCYN